MGNHEFYVGQYRSQNFLEQAGFIVLRNRAVVLDSLINIAGVDDPGRTGRYAIGNPHFDPLAERAFHYFFKAPAGSEQIQPGAFRPAAQRPHPRWPDVAFQFVVRLIHGYFPGLHRLSQRSWLYLSRGTGTWGPPMRFLVPPEITLIESGQDAAGPWLQGRPAAEIVNRPAFV